MDKQDFKKLLDDAFEPIRVDIKTIKEDLQDVKEDLQNVKEVQEKRVLPSVIETEVTVKSYADSYKINQHNIEKLDIRLSSAEKKLDMEVPEDLKVEHFTSSAV